MPIRILYYLFADNTIALEAIRAFLVDTSSNMFWKAFQILMELPDRSIHYLIQYLLGDETSYPIAMESDTVQSSVLGKSIHERSTAAVPGVRVDRKFQCSGRDSAGKRCGHVKFLTSTDARAMGYRWYCSSHQNQATRT